MSCTSVSSAPSVSLAGSRSAKVSTRRIDPDWLGSTAPTPETCSLLGVSTDGCLRRGTPALIAVSTPAPGYSSSPPPGPGDPRAGAAAPVVAGDAAGSKAAALLRRGHRPDRCGLPAELLLAGTDGARVHFRVRHGPT